MTTAVGAIRSEKLGLAVRVLLGSLLLALSAQIAIPLPFSPVPIALAPAMAILLGLRMGSYAGMASVLLYLLEGGLGLPFFAHGGMGPAVLLGPTGGYLLGYLPAAYIAGRLSSRPLLAYAVGSAAIYACGLPQLALFVGWGRVLALGLFPFLPGWLLKGALFSKCAS